MFILKKGILCENILRMFLFVAVIFCSAQVAHAQVTIGSSQTPHKDALLDLQQDGVTTRGLLLPRVALESTTSFKPMSEHTKGMLVYNTATVGDVTPGLYENNGIKWMKLSTADDSFFYLPSTTLPTDELDAAFDGTKFTVNLHDSYKAQFAQTALNVRSSEPAADYKLPVYEKNELYYFVTYYDEDVFDEVKINPDGELTYTLKPGFTYSEKTFMNIVLKVK